MIELLKRISSPLFHYFSNKKIREFYRLLNSTYPRYKNVHGVKFLDFKVDVVDYLSFAWQFKEIFVDEIYDFESHKKDPVIYDCGSNIGLSILFFKKKYPAAKIFAFEADSVVFGILEKNIINNKAGKDVFLYNKAVWIDDSGVDFGGDGADGGSIKSNNNVEKVDSIKLKCILENEKFIDFLKIDIEGAELDVLKDCKDSLNNVGNLFLEYHSLISEKQKLSELIFILEDNGFRYYIEDLCKKKSPFIKRSNSELKSKMDLQLNIFAWRD